MLYDGSLAASGRACHDDVGLLHLNGVLVAILFHLEDLVVVVDGSTEDFLCLLRKLLRFQIEKRQDIFIGSLCAVRL